MKVKVNVLAMPPPYIFFTLQLVHESSLVATVKPLNKGHIGDGPFVPRRKLVLFSEVLFLTYWKFF